MLREKVAVVAAVAVDARCVSLQATWAMCFGHGDVIGLDAARHIRGNVVNRRPSLPRLLRPGEHLLTYTTLPTDR